MDGPALGTGLFGILVGAAALYQVTKRRWWALVGIVSIGAAGMLSLVTEGPRPHDERAAVSVAEAALLFSFLVAAIVQSRQARRKSAATRRP
jgi:lysylphosphatidylglycerol synthetase-like protein (DUF2156 family)